MYKCMYTLHVLLVMLCFMYAYVCVNIMKCFSFFVDYFTVHHVGGRKRKPKAAVHILPSLTPGPVPPLTMGASGIRTGTGSETGGGGASVISQNIGHGESSLNDIKIHFINHVVLLIQYYVT